MRTFSPDVPMQTLQYKVIFVLLNTLKLLMNLSLQKHRFNAIFRNQTYRHPHRLKKQIWVEKTQWEPWSHGAKRLLYRNLKRT